MRQRSLGIREPIQGFNRKKLLQSGSIRQAEGVDL